MFSHQKQAARLSRESSPPLLLFNITSGRPLRDTDRSPASSVDLEEEKEEEEEDSDQDIEEWMILGGEEELGDSNIQLNLSYWSSSEEDSEDEDQNMNTWAVSLKDKCGADPSLPVRYFAPGGSLICNICNRTGHLAKNCYYHKKCPTCVLCGIQGHIQRDCPSRPCPICGLPSHGFRPCERPPLWNQHCQRCGVSGHLSDTCPDTWRQYHLTIQLDVPLRPRTVHTLNRQKCIAHCYNCSVTGHYGYECTKRRMISGTSPSLPYVCHYDTMEDILQGRTRTQKRAEELVGAGAPPLSDQQHSEPTVESGEDNQPAQGRSRTKQDTCSRAGRRKTWPERRKERREVKRLRREAQARREGGLLGRSRGNFDDEVCPADPFRFPLDGHRQPTPPPQRKRKRDEEGGRHGSRKSREAERWKKRGGVKHGDLYPHGDIDKDSENLLSPKQRVRHRRR
ncbi:Zinc finger CCHC domain-containing protein 7 TRAMP-like complex RNA-binding factor ZCCHC7 [Collichthys lucidus]|uniref:Zinc finger CCHC domain-containing protein 7 n=1 Tax=Collichthys lucidus TaxID=240159 RepID=A0A4U5UCS0_COLLU|nr:Zinc finger CCHC domain-containing protein 7 TRAMP-like complex RNA-binding factor ZCCHC7 [Collichthys lucidus]